MPPWDDPVDGAVAVTDWEDHAGEVVERREGGTVIGWARIELVEEIDDATIAADMRVEMRNDGGSWVVARTEMRSHCAQPLTGGECR